VAECLRRIPEGVRVRARFDSGFYDSRLFARLEEKGVTFLCGARMTYRLISVIRQIPESCWSPCIDKDDGEVAEFGYLIDHDRVFRRYVVKRIPVAVGEQMEIETSGYHYWVLVTNDHATDAAALESEHRHKAQVESGVRELKENFGLDVLRKHGFMANWAWLLVVATALNLTRWSQLLGSLDDDRDIRAKRLRYRYLNVPALLVRCGRRLVLKLQRSYPCSTGLPRRSLACSRFQCRSADGPRPLKALARRRWASVAFVARPPHDESPNAT
jgi:Transposase DDE domain group 1